MTRSLALSYLHLYIIHRRRLSIISSLYSLEGYFSRTNGGSWRLVYFPCDKAITRVNFLNGEPFLSIFEVPRPAGFVFVQLAVRSLRQYQDCCIEKWVRRFEP